MGNNEGITTTGESTRQHNTEHISTTQSCAYGIVPGTDADNSEYETLEFNWIEHISTKQCNIYCIVPETDADNIIITVIIHNFAPPNSFEITNDDAAFQF